MSQERKMSQDRKMSLEKKLSLERKNKVKLPPPTIVGNSAEMSPEKKNRGKLSQPTNVSYSAETSQEKKNKVKLPPPTNMTDVVREVILQVARKYLFLDLYKKAIAYLFIVGVLSLLAPHLSLRQDWYFAQRYNFLNVMFVKLSWFWTSTLTGAFIFLTASVYGCANVSVIGKHMSRLLVGTAVWYYCTTWFVDLERWTGSCIGFKTSSRSVCAANAGKWVPGFDISGHCFLLIYCCLVICEEVRAFRDWDKLRSLLERPEQDHSAFTRGRPSNAELELGNAAHQKQTTAIKLVFIALFFLHILWEFMILITVLYYHTFAHKMAGSAIAVAAWFVTYRLWYRTPVSPGLPGDCKISYRDRSLSMSRRFSK